MGKVESIEDFKNSKKPSMEQWKRLYEVAEKIKKQEPWVKLSDTNFIMAELPSRYEPYFCSVMGYGGQCYGIAVYPGYEAFGRLEELLETYDGFSYNTNTFEQKSLLCYFGDRDELTPKDRSVIKSLGLKFRGRNQWIYFRRAEPGRLPWYISANQADMLAEALEAVYESYEIYNSGGVNKDFLDMETLLCTFSDETGKYDVNVVPLPKVQKTIDNWSMNDEIMLARLKMQKKVPMELEMDTFYLPFPIQEDSDKAPMLPRLSIALDREDGMLLGQDMEDGPSSPMSILNCFVDFIMEHGRPMAIYVRNEKIESILKNTCKYIGVNLFVDNDMNLTNDFIDNMLQFLGQ